MVDGGGRPHSADDAPEVSPQSHCRLAAAAAAEKW